MEFKSILKMDFYRLYRNKAMKIIVLIPILGVWLNFNALLYEPNFFLDYLKMTGFILAFTMAPIIFTASILASKDEEIFSIINMNIPFYIVSKIINLIPIILYSFIFAIVPYYFLGQKNNVELATIIYYIKSVLVYYSIYLVVYASVGYFLGAIFGNILKGAFSFMFGIMFIYFSAGFEKTPVKDVNLSNINGYTLTNIFRFDIYTNKIFEAFLLMAITLLFIYFMLSAFKQRKKSALILLIPIVLLGYLGSVAFIKLEAYKYNEVENYQRLSADSVINGELIKGTHENTVKKSQKTSTVIHSVDDEGFIVNKYVMNIELEDELKNRVEMDITLTDKAKEEIKFQFYGKSDISKMKVNGEDVNYTMDSSTLYIDLASIDLKGNNELKIEMDYSAYIYTYIDVYGYHYVNRSGAFLDTNLAWYPMIDNNKNKNFDLIINTDNERLFSNLDVAKSSNGYKLSGESPNIILLSGDKSITSITKDGIEYYGLDLFLNSEENIDSLALALSQEDEIEKNEEEKMGIGIRFYDRNSIRKIFITGTGIAETEQVGNAINF